MMNKTIAKSMNSGPSVTAEWLKKGVVRSSVGVGFWSKQKES